MKIGITGHQTLEDPVWVREKIAEILHSQAKPLIGITSLAVGADQMFARCVLSAAGCLHVVIPLEEYKNSFTLESLQEYERLLSKAAEVEVLPTKASREECYFDAGKKVVGLSDLMIAVWNGKPAAGWGGTGDIVDHIISQTKPYFHIDVTSHEVVFHP